MKVKILATVILLITLGTCALNTYFLLRSMDGVKNDAESMGESIVSGTESVVDDATSAIKDDDKKMNFMAGITAKEAKEGAQALFDSYKRAEIFLSLTVSHNDLTDIESFFSEMIGYLSVSDMEGAEMAKNRLIDALAHLRRLSGVNMSSIF